MIKAHIEIGEDGKFDSYEKWGFIYVGSDNVFSAPLKKQDSISYAGENGEWIDKRAVPDAFTYKIKFVIVTPNNDTENANEKIHAFNEALYNVDENGVKTLKTITIYNYFKRVKIVGVPTPISEVSSVYRRVDGSVEDCFEIELSVRVDKPDLCDFHLKNGAIPLEIRLVNNNTYDPETGGGVMDDNLYIQFSRPLEPDEHVCLLRRGATKRDSNGRAWADSHLNSIPTYTRPSRHRRQNRWIVYYNGSIWGYGVSGYTQIIEWPLEHYEQFNRNDVAANFEWDGGASDDAYLIEQFPNDHIHNMKALMGFGWNAKYVVGSEDYDFRILKGPNSTARVSCPQQYPIQINGNAVSGVTFGIGVYKADKYRVKYGSRVLTKVKRVSNVCYFRKFIEVEYYGRNIIQNVSTWTHIP